MKTLRDYWFTTMNGTIGVVIGEDKLTGERKGYIGMAGGHNQQADIEVILEYGSPISIPILQEILQALMPQK